MSHPHLPPVRQEDDRIRGVAVFLVITAATLFGTLCVFASWLLWRANVSTFHPGGLPPVAKVEETQPAIWGVNQTLINVDSATRRMTEERRRHLDQHRWIDREAGIAQIPIQEAMRALAAEAAGAMGQGGAAGSAGSVGSAGVVR